MTKMYCDVAIQRGLLDGECFSPLGSQHAITVFKASNGEAYVLDGVYFQDVDTTGLTDDRAWNPDDLMIWNNYQQDGGDLSGSCPDCKGFVQDWGQMKSIEPNADSAAGLTGGSGINRYGFTPTEGNLCDYTSDENCAWHWDWYPATLPELDADHVVSATTIQDSMTGIDLKVQRWESYGLTPPLDKFDFSDIGTFAQAQYA